MKKQEEFLHELSSPLAAISLLLETLLEDIPEPTDLAGVRDRLLAIASAVEKMRVEIEARKKSVGDIADRCG